MNDNVLPEGYEVMEISDGDGGYEYVIEKAEEEWCHYSGMPSPKAYEADMDAQDPKWGNYKI